MKLKKVYNIKIVSCILALSLFFNNIAFADRPASKTCLRAQLISSREAGQRRLSTVVRNIWNRRNLKLFGMAAAGAVIVMLAFAGHKYFNKVRWKDTDTRWRLTSKRILDAFKKADVYTFDTSIDMPDIKCGDISIILCNHGSSDDFLAIMPILDAIFDKAKKESKKIVCYSENAPPTSLGEFKEEFPNLDIKKAFKDKGFKEVTEKRYKDLLNDYQDFLENPKNAKFSEGRDYDLVLRQGITDKAERDVDLESMAGFIFFRNLYMQYESLYGECNISFVHERPRFSTYMFGVKIAMEGDYTKAERKGHKATIPLRNRDLKNLISASYDDDVYTVVIIGTSHVGLTSLLQRKKLPVKSYIFNEHKKYLFERHFYDQRKRLKQKDYLEFI